MVPWLAVNFMCDQPVFYNAALVLNRLAIGSALVMGVPLLAFVVVTRASTQASRGGGMGLLPVSLLGTLAATTPWSSGACPSRAGAPTWPRDRCSP